MQSVRLLFLAIVLGLVPVAVPTPAIAQGFGQDRDGGIDGFFTPRDRRLQGSLEQALEQLSLPEGDHRGALQDLQRIISAGEDVFTGPAMDVSVREQAAQTLASLPRELQQTYEEMFGQEAAALLNSAEGPLRRRQQEVVRHFFQTDAGADAAFHLAATEMDAGRGLMAARLLDRLRAEHHRRDAFEPQLSTRCLWLYWQNGEHTKAAEILTSIRQQHNELSIAGVSVPALTKTEAAEIWLAQNLQTPQRVEGVAGSNWHSPQGSLSHNTSVAPVSPLFDDLWTVALLGDRDAGDPILREELSGTLDGTVRAAREAGWTTTPVMTPILVGDLVVFPSYGLVKAVDVNSGRLRWVAFPEDQTFADAVSRMSSGRPSRSTATVEDFFAQRAWRDATSSQISSDGERVYVVRDSGMVGGLAPQFSMSAGVDHPLRARSYNNLRAYDAEGGRWTWEIGGPRTRAALSLAGTFFLGPPLAFDGTLYILGEDLGQVRLHALDPRTGELEWSLPLANADADIEDEVDRRLAGLSPTLAGGLLICPTGAGLVMAVDPLSREVEWGMRYREPQPLVPQQFGRGPFIGLQASRAQQVSVAEIMQQPRWHDPGVVAVGTSLLVMPPDIAGLGDEQRLICLSLLDGSTRWQRGRQDALFVGGVREGIILLIGERQAQGVDLASGRPVWTLPLPTPSGRGVRSDALYHLPLTTGEIATIDVTRGELVARSSMRSGQSPGNLIALNGRLLSQTATEVRAFRSRTEVQQQLSRDLAANADDPAALGVRGESRLHSGEIEAGLADLRASAAQNPDQRTRTLLATTLLEGLRTHFAEYRNDVQEIERLATSQSLRRQFLQTYADGLLTAEETALAFEQFLRLLAETPPDSSLEYVSDGRWVRPDRRVQGQVSHLYASADDELRRQMDHRIDGQLAAAGVSERPRLFSRLVEALPDREFNEAVAVTSRHDLKLESELLKARRSAGPDEQPVIAARLAELYAVHGREEPLLQLLEELRTVWGESATLDGKTGAEWAASLSESDDVAALLSAAVNWPNGNTTVAQADGQQGPIAAMFPLRTDGPIDPLTATQQFLPDNGGRVSIRDGFGRVIQDGTLTLLPTGATGFPTQYVMRSGHRAVLALGTQFKLINLLDGSPQVVLEDQLVDNTPADMVGLRMTQRRAVRQLGFRGQVLWSDEPGESGSVGPLNDSVFCYLRGTTLFAHDPFTGKPYWRVDGVPHGAEVFADDEYVLVVPLGQHVVHVYRALDGEPLGDRKLPSDVIRDRRWADWGRHFLRQTDGDSKAGLAMYDPVADENVWELPISQPFTWTPRDGYEICVVRDDGQLTLHDPMTGEVLLESQVDVPQRLLAIRILNLPDQWWLTTYARPTNEADSQLAPVQITTGAFAINGPVTAFNRGNDKILWSRTIENQMVMSDLPPRWPLVPLSGVRQTTPQTTGRRELGTLVRQIELIDRRTGKALHSTQTDGTNRQLDVFWQVAATPPQLSLRFGQMNLRITFAEPAPAPPVPDDPETPDKSPPESDESPDEKPPETSAPEE